MKTRIAIICLCALAFGCRSETTMVGEKESVVREAWGQPIGEEGADFVFGEPYKFGGKKLLYERNSKRIAVNIKSGIVVSIEIIQ